MPYWINVITGIPYDFNTGLPLNGDKSAFTISASKQSLMTSILSAGTFFGALMAGDIADYFVM